MRRQKSFSDEKPILYLVPTPIGNFLDMTYRAVSVLKEVDYIYCEDTRVTKVLLSHFNINTPVNSYHIFNENVQVEEVMKHLEAGEKIALVSDAGLPCISDPGFFVARKAIEAGFNVISLPGANAALTALIASGIECTNFYFFGFLNSKQTQRVKQLKTLQDIKETLIFYEAPHRIFDTLRDMYQIFGDREVVIARELTKKFEEYLRGKLSEIINEVMELKGEIVIIVSGASMTEKQASLLAMDIKSHYEYYLNQGSDEKTAMKQVASDRKMAKSNVYKVIKVEPKEKA
jgi:16S rRNA (cytidine1402-2'-O)-methyltransferase